MNSGPILEFSGARNVLFAQYTLSTRIALLLISSSETTQLVII